MKSFITDSNNDLTFDKFGNLRFEEGIEAYRQHIVNEIKLQQYEYGYDPERGINYLGYILGQTSGNLVAWENQILDVINKMPFIKTVLEWKTNIVNNTLLFRLVVDTDLGKIEIKG